MCPSGVFQVNWNMVMVALRVVAVVSEVVYTGLVQAFLTP